MRTTVVRRTVIGVSVMVATAAATSLAKPERRLCPQHPTILGRRGPFDP